MSEQVTAFEIDLSDVRNEAQDTQKTLKELRQEVKDLRSQLENTAIGTEEFTDTLDELTRKQQELTNVTKSGVAAQKDSYNDLVNQMAILKKEWRATADEAERAALGDQISEINSKLKEMDATLGNHQRNVGNYESALENVNIQLQDQNNNFQTGIQTVQGLLGAYQLVEGALQAFGVESEVAEEAIRKMQGVMAMTDGLRAINEGITGFKQLRVAIQGATLMTNGLKVALISTGIGAAVVAIGLLIANWDKLSKRWKDDTSAKTLKESIDSLNKALDTNKKLMERDQENAYSRYRQAVIDAKGDVDKLKEAEKQLADEIERTARATYEANLAEAWKEETEAYREYLRVANSRFTSADRKREAAEEFTQIKDARIKAQQELTRFEQENTIKKLEAERDALNDSKQQYLDYLKSLNDKMKSYGLEGIGRDPFLTPLAKYNQGIKDLEEFLKHKLITEEDYLRERKELQDHYELETRPTFGSVITPEQQEAFTKSLNDTLASGLSVERHYADMRLQISEFESERLKKLEEERIEKKKQTIDTMIGISADLFGSTAELMKEDTVAQKALLTAQTLLNTYMGTMSAFAQTPGPIWVKIAAAVAAGSLGAVQLKNIWSVDPENPESSVGGSGSRIPSMSALQQLQNGPQATTVIQGASTEMDVKDTRVYVVESDITNTQNKVKTIESESTF